VQMRPVRSSDLMRSDAEYTLVEMSIVFFEAGCKDLSTARIFSAFVLCDMQLVYQCRQKSQASVMHDSRFTLRTSTNHVMPLTMI
jgi:hypothetical protein